MADKQKYLTVKGVAEYLALSEKTVRDLIKKGELDALESGGRYRIRTDALTRFEEANRYRYQDLSTNPYNDVA